MMGSGKTTVGRATARRLGWEFCDSDQQVELRAGRTVAEIWREDGEPAFRRLEKEALEEALARTAERPVVIAAAGGTVLDPANRALLRRHPPVVWLRARPDTLARRIQAGHGAHRPLLADDPAGALRTLDAEREPCYREVADAVIDVDRLPRHRVVDRVVALARSS
jgi:shikimate kinase